MTGLWKEFKEFAFKGNMIDLAVAVVIGGAFGKVIDALVKAVIMPAITTIMPGKNEYAEWAIGDIKIGVFLAELVNFLIIALAIFLVVVKTLGALRKFGQKPAESGEPTIKQCPLCLSDVPYKASKCRFCTSDLPAAA